MSNRDVVPQTQSRRVARRLLNPVGQVLTSWISDCRGLDVAPDFAIVPHAARACIQLDRLRDQICSSIS